ncbi:MAG: NAD-dependent epimerase/dehydratase family protein [Flavobacteriales bacterium]|nr:NAD-dependent epimerase/dehydratase family protein [Flavobacteriales bacterium]NNK80305.1 NAD-dependent epimerase/dehydratase family protein [Flavobacteriales bacterium]
MNTILVTGGAGFIASEIAIRLAQDSNNHVVVVDNLITGDTDKLPLEAYDNLNFIRCDVNNFDDIAGIFYSYNFDYVFHYAALVGVLRTLNNPVNVLDDITGIRNILKLSKNTRVKRVYYSSSSEVYGEPVEIPQNEQTTPLNSKLPYAIVKNIGEASLRSYYQEYGLEFTIFRFFNTYGPKQSPDFVISKFMKAAMSGDDITIYGDGSQTRTFCYIDDNVDACLACFYQDRYVNDVLNIGSNVEMTIKELAQFIIDVTTSNSRIVHLPPLAEGDMKRRLPDNSKMMELLDRPLMKLEDGLKLLISTPDFILA